MHVLQEDRSFSQGRWLNGVPWWNRALFKAPNSILLRKWMDSDQLFNFSVKQMQPFSGNECGVYSFANSPPSSSWLLVPYRMRLPITVLICQKGAVKGRTNFTTLTIVYCNWNPIFQAYYQSSCLRSSHSIYINLLCHHKQSSMYKDGKSIYSASWRITRSFPILTYLRDRYCPSRKTHVCIETVQKRTQVGYRRDLISLKMSNGKIMHSINTCYDSFAVDDICVHSLTGKYPLNTDPIEIANNSRIVLQDMFHYYRSNSEIYRHAHKSVYRRVKHKLWYFLRLPEHTDDSVLCPNNYYTCSDRSCIHFSQVHNGEKDCLDNSNETRQSRACDIHWTFECSIYQPGNCTCTAHSYQCPSGGCVPWEKVCDDVNDCQDMSDETSCRPQKKSNIPTKEPLTSTAITQARDKMFHCKANTKWIPRTWLNDGHADCVTAVKLQNVDFSTSQMKYVDYDNVRSVNYSLSSEEEETNQYTPVKSGNLPCSSNGLQTFPFKKLCHFDYDEEMNLAVCRSGNHLRYCQDIQCSGRFKCSRSYCISISRLCDTVLDCPHGEDELDCPEGFLSCPGMNDPM